MSERKTGSGERQDAEQPEAVEQNEPQGRTLKFPELPERRSLMGGVMFRKKLARARAFQKERSGESEEAPEEGIPLEKHDVSTMIFRFWEPVRPWLLPPWQRMQSVWVWQQPSYCLAQTL